MKIVPQTVLASLLTLLISQFAFSKESVIQKHICLEGESQEIYDILKNYKAQETYDKSSPYLKMKESTPFLLSQNNLNLDHVVRYQLKPKLAAREYFPRFLLRCLIKTENLNNIEQKCSLIDQSPDGSVKMDSFGVNDVSINLSAKKGDRNSECYSDQTHLFYEVTIDTNDNEMKQLKKNMTGDNVLLKLILDLFNDEQSFFEKFYTSFYRSAFSGMIDYSY